MTIDTKSFLINVCKAILDRNLDHDCRLPYEPCSYCEKAYVAIEELKNYPEEQIVNPLAKNI